MKNDDMNALLSAMMFLELLWPIARKNKKVMAELGKKIGTIQ